MDPYKHSKISVQKRGGDLRDYYPIHFFMDSTKELCSDNRHRILHTLWGIRRVILPIFGETIINSDNQEVLVKEICEEDHVLPDYQNRFIPTLSDFVDALQINDPTIFNSKINTFYAQHNLSDELKSLLLSPLALTGQLKSLIVTHNSWFINEIVPRVFPLSKPLLTDFGIGGAEIFQSMKYEIWMDNGIVGAPKSMKKYEK